MIIYGTAILAACHLLGVYIGDLLGSLIETAQDWRTGIRYDRSDRVRGRALRFRRSPWRPSKTWLQP